MMNCAQLNVFRGKEHVEHPDLERDDILAALEFGALAAGRRRVVPLGAG